MNNFTAKTLYSELYLSLYEEETLVVMHTVHGEKGKSGTFI